MARPVIIKSSIFFFTTLDVMLALSLVPSEPFFYDPQQSFTSKFHKVEACLSVCRYNPGYRPIYLPNVLHGLPSQCQTFLLSANAPNDQSAKWLSLLINS